MAKFDDAKAVVSNLSAQLTEDRLAEVRCLGGIGYLAPGSLTELVKDQPFSVEDIVTVLLAGWIMQTEEIKRQNEQTAELENLCNQQQKAIDDVADQAMRLRSLLGNLLPDGEPVRPVDLLKDIAARAGTDPSAER